MRDRMPNALSAKCTAHNRVDLRVHEQPYLHPDRRLVHAVSYLLTEAKDHPLTYLRYFLFQAGLIPIVFLMTDPSNPEAQNWLEEIETTKALLTHPSLGNNRFAARCSEVIHRLLNPPSDVMSGLQLGGPTSLPQQPYQQPPPGFMPFPEHLFSEPGFPGSFFATDQPMPSPAGMDFSEWVTFPTQEQ